MKNIFQFILTGFIFCFIFKNLFLIVYYSSDRDIINIILNPDLDFELWYIFLFTYLLTVKVYFSNFFNLFMSELNNYKYLKLLLLMYFNFKKRIYFKFIIKVFLLLLSIITFVLGYNFFTKNQPDSSDVFEFLLFTYLTFTFNENYKIIEFKSN